MAVEAVAGVLEDDVAAAGETGVLVGGEGGGEEEGEGPGEGGGPVEDEAVEGVHLRPEPRQVEVAGDGGGAAVGDDVDAEEAHERPVAFAGPGARRWLGNWEG